MDASGDVLQRSPVWSVADDVVHELPISGNTRHLRSRAFDSSGGIFGWSEGGASMLVLGGSGSTVERRLGLAQYARQSPFLWGGCLIISEPVLWSHDALHAEAAAMGLTTRQVDVAMMLTERMSSREIAAVFQISPYTARHHTEHVLMKLRASSRFAVAERLSGTRSTHDRPRARPVVPGDPLHPPRVFERRIRPHT